LNGENYSDRPRLCAVAQGGGADPL